MSRSRNWRHQLMRVKQIADQNLGRAEKTEVITEQIHALEKRIDLVGKVCGSTSKKLQAYLVSTGPDAEKRLKKIPENGLSLSMIEASNLLGAETLMGSLFKICGDAQFFLAKELMTHEYEVESNVLGPIHTILENEIPNIQKLKKNLAKLVLDMDTAKTKYHSAQKQHQQGNMSQQKVEATKDEFEDTETRVLQVRDQLTTEMLSFTARESEFSKILVTLMEAQATYHKRALEVLERLSPQMQDTMVKHEQMPVYNYPLEDHLRRTDRHIAMVLEACVVTLLEEAMEEEGLFRIAGGASKLKKLKATFDSGTPDNTDIDLSEFIQDVHSIAGALKLYLRELPEPLMTYDLYDEWMQAAHLPHEQRLQALWVLVNKLPKPNFDNLRYLMKFFARMSEFSEKNKMSARNIAIVIGPNLIWPDGDGGPSPLTTSTQSAIVEDFINHVDYFFPGDIDFHDTMASEASSETQNAPATGSHQSSSTTKDAPAAGLQHTPPGTINAPPAGLQQTLEEVSVGTVASQPPLSKGSPSASSGSLTVESNSGGASPATLRKAGKKPAPPPPTDRHSVVPEKSPSPYHSSDNLLFSVPAAADGEKHAHPERPSAPPTVAEKPCIPSSPRADRPRGPPPDRPQGPPPDRPQGPPPQKPEKPEKPPSPAVLSKPPAIPDKPQTPPSIPEKPVSPLSTEKPQTLPVGAEKQELLRPDDGSKPDNTTQTHRQSTAGGVKPPRPNPPPPLPPRKSRGGSDKSAEIHLEDTSSSQRKSKGSPIEENTPL